MARKTAIWLILIAFTLAYCSPENTAKADMAVKLKSKTLPSGSIAVVSMVTLLDRSVSKELLDYNSSVLQSVLSGMSRRNKIVDLSVLKGSLGKREYNRFLRDYKRSGVISSNWYRKIKESNPDLRYILLPTVESHGLSREYRDSEEANKKTAMYTVGIIVVIAAIVVAVALSKDKGGGKASGLLGKSKGGLRGGKPARRGYARARGGSKAGGWRKGRGGRPRSSRVKGHPGKHKGELKGGSSGKHRGKYKTPSTAGKQPGIARTAGGKGHPGRHIGESKGGAPGRHLGKYKGHSGKGSGPASAKVTGGSGKKPMPEAGVKGGSGATASGKTGAGKRWRGSR
ncbi:MAG: hypothetical protein OEZ36_13415, partial [Spirochaetota bacterium]|nr:hypothetical protein [Spirochaetota bacterium]